MNLTVEVVRKPCAFILQIREPTDTLRRLAMFFEDRHIQIDTLQMHRLGPSLYSGGEAMLIIHCHIEKDRIARTVLLLEQMPGIMEMQRMEGK